MAILRDPASGQVRGFFSELPQDVGTAAAAAAAIDAEPGLRVLFSRGIPDAAGVAAMRPGGMGLGRDVA